MSESKDKLLARLRECAVLLELRGDNPFRCRAYENGARALEALEGDPADWIADDRLKGVKGVGKGLTEAIEAWVDAGELELYEELKAEIPPGLTEMLHIPGLGAKKIKALWKELGVDTLEKLEAAAGSEAVAELPGFGKKSAEKILAGIEQRKKYSGRHRLNVALAAAEKIFDQLGGVKSIRRIELAGSMRRRRETIKDLDFVVDSDRPEEVMEAFIATPGVERVVNHGATKSSILLTGGVPADLRVVARKEFAAALNYFTGSKLHNTHMRGRAKRMGMRLNEYALSDEKTEKAIPCADEAAIYEKLGLVYIEPELREDAGEIEAAEEGKLPHLIEAEDMRGLLHCHSHYSDGKSSLEEMVQAAKKAGYRYFGVCDHSQAAAYAGGLGESDVLRQHKEIDRLSARIKGLTIFKGIEADILAEGEIDFSDRFLKKFDFVVISVHSRFQLSREDMTRRICRAVSHPAATILGHPTGRLLLEREPYEVDLDEVFRTAAAHEVAVEINANPHRLDLDWTYIRRAKAAGCIFTINPDAHHVDGIADNGFGVGIARKGWLEAGDVINTMTTAKFKAWLKSRGQPSAKS